ncbi:hypothetical protein V1514DRAFT_283584 [Lipomyces japonicus]|uniref:uncharacterized protein n=1 Tax=Lipomyces japonicus TaxID=56871 RepID=UPI0034CFA463
MNFRFYWTQLYNKWRSIKIPLRKKFYVGQDLDGNTFWEFENKNMPSRPRRIVQLRNRTQAYIDYKLPPQWNQWLRYVRHDPPTIEELQNEELRLATLKQRILEADARWKSIPLKTKSNIKDDVPISNLNNAFIGDFKISDSKEPNAFEDRTLDPSLKNKAENQLRSQPNSNEFRHEVWSQKPLKRQ